jgi:hypothetical protein
MFLLFVNKTRQAQTFFAIIEHDHWGYENVGNYFDSGAAHDFRGGLYRPASDKRSPDYTKGELKPLLVPLRCPKLPRPSQRFSGTIAARGLYLWE